jgi:hypothetical protein
VRWSARIGRFAGIDVYVHVTFLLLLLFFAWRSWQATGTLAGVLSGTLLILMLFLCVLLHEYGHALTARRFGIGTRHITLLPIGGLALLESMPKDPRQEILVALANLLNLCIDHGKTCIHYADLICSFLLTRPFLSLFEKKENCIFYYPMLQAGLMIVSWKFYSPLNS